ncbi:hypothetical protein M0R04_09205 [Candidatus Dojkabacteria bacterium]|jgi:hypothetical protein|nr:hypothetical protein [Candidatus Dojkabacteria bacterium]
MIAPDTIMMFDRKEYFRADIHLGVKAELERTKATLAKAEAELSALKARKSRGFVKFTPDYYQAAVLYETLEEAKKHTLYTLPDTVICELIE